MHFTSVHLHLPLELRKMDALVHIMYEVAGTCGALASVKLIQVFGNNFSFLITPPLFFLGGVTWSFIDRLGHGTDADGAIEPKSTENPNYLHSILVGAKAFGRSTYKGAAICFTHRRFIWLLPGYSFARTYPPLLSFLSLSLSTNLTPLQSTAIDISKTRSHPYLPNA